MYKKRRNSAKYAIGIYVEGEYLQVVCLSKKGKKIRLVDAEILKLAERLETVTSENEIVFESVDVLEGDTVSSNPPPDMPQDSFVFTESEEKKQKDNIDILEEILSKYLSKKYQLSISLAEPQIYYAYFNTDWNLQGDKLKNRIIQELSKERQVSTRLKPDDLFIIKLSDDRILAVVRDTNINLINLIETVQKNLGRRLPYISFIESAEISLVNLVKENYHFKDDDISVIVYVGHEYSRLIFLRGNDIHNISYIIGAGLDSENIANTIFSRILLEQDNLNLPRLDNIILAGEAYEVQLDAFLKQKLSDEINIDYIKFQKIDVSGIDPLLSKYAVAIGAAQRVLDSSNPVLLNVDLTPFEVRENQKKFKLGAAGWFLLLLIPFLAFFTTIKTSYQHRELNQIISQVQFNRSELSHLQEIEMRLNVQRTRLANLDKALQILDTLTVGTKTWSTFLKNLADYCKSIGDIWITEVKPSKEDQVVLSGYSIYRNRIPRMARALGNASLQKVEVQEIRKRKVYHFEIVVKLQKK